MILLQWDLPVDVTTSFLSHYIVYFKSATLMIPPQSTVAALNVESCKWNATVGIYAVDICGQEAGVKVILKDVLQETGNVAEPPSQTTTASQPDTSK